MPQTRHGKPVVKPTAIAVLLSGIEQAKINRVPLYVINNLEAELASECVLAMLNNQNPIQN